jgi:hypothetical protein
LARPSSAIQMSTGTRISRRKLRRLGTENIFELVASITIILSRILKYLDE